MTKGKTFILALVVFAALLLCGASSALAASQIVDSISGRGTLGGEFGENPRGVAVNNTGAGPANQGDIYAVDESNNRIQRFGHDDHGTPGDTRDDTYFFISAWGADVDSTPPGGSDYEICTVAAECKSSPASGGNGTNAGNGSLSVPSKVAVDQDTGDVYVTDKGNSRVSVYDGAGSFLRTFGYDVVASGPGSVTAPDEQQELTVKATAGKFSLSFNGKFTGPTGTGWRHGGSTILDLFEPAEGTFHAGDSISGRGIAPGTTILAINGGSLILSKPATESTVATERLFGDDLDLDASAAQVQDALNALTTIGGVGGSVTVTGGPGDATGSNPYVIHFAGSLAEENVPVLIANDENLELNGGSGSVTSVENPTGGAYEICNPSVGDVCKAGNPGPGTGALAGGENALFYPMAIAISQPDGNPSSGKVFVADAINHRVDVFGLDGSSPTSFGASTFYSQPLSGWAHPTAVAVDSRGIVYASNIVVSPQNTILSDRVERYDSENANGNGIGFLSPIVAPPLANSGSGQPTNALAVNPDSDGAGSDTDALFVLRAEETIQRFGPLNSPGAISPPTAADETESYAGLSGLDLSLDEASGRIYVQRYRGEAGPGIYVLDAPNPTQPTASLDSVSDVTSSSAVVHATINPSGPPDTSYHFEYSTDGSSWTALPTVLLGRQESPQVVEGALNPPPFGLSPNTTYHVRLVYQRKFSPPPVIASPSELTFTTDPAKPIVESAGTPLRTATSAQLQARVDPNGGATTYHFEYGSEGPCDASPCSSTPSRSAGSGDLFKFAAEAVEGLQPNTTYHYRVVADNGAVGPAVAGDDAIVTTKALEAPLSHGHFPGPPGSDRAWEMVSLPNSGGNPVFGIGFSAEGDRAAYRVAGGAPSSDSGSPAGQYFAQRFEAGEHQGGWHTQLITPSRDQLVGPDWDNISPNGDLSAWVARNRREGSNSAAIWRYGPSSTASKLLDIVPPTGVRFLGTSADTARVVVEANGSSLDPSRPVPVAKDQLYELSTGSPHLVSLLPGEDAPSCGVGGPGQGFDFVADSRARSLSADGEHLFFPSQGDGPCDSSTPSLLYMRDLKAGETRSISASPISGPTCSAMFIKSTAGAAFFWTQSRLSADDAVPAGCTSTGEALDGDVYRYDIGDGGLECVTCVVPGFDVDVPVRGEAPGGAASVVGVSDDGSRVYFRSAHALLRGTPAGEEGVYRVGVASADLAYVGPFVSSFGLGSLRATADGSVLIFRSGIEDLNPLGGAAKNGGTSQVYRYDDLNGSLVCISCPTDGSLPKGAAGNQPVFNGAGDILAFSTPTALTGVNQNTSGPGQRVEAGTDVYEWRDGRFILLTDGLTNWPRSAEPFPEAISPNGHDIFINAYAQYTPDALDAYSRIYDARLGGGFEYPKAVPPCPLEVCQGTPKGSPEEQTPSTGTFVGPDNAAKAPPARCKKGKVRKRGACVSKKHSKKQTKSRQRGTSKHNGRAH